MDTVEYRPNVGWVTCLLSLVAGFCDTATFVRGGSIFSAHVTGNFIVFAAQLVSENRSPEGWARLMTFPVFVLAVMTGGWIVRRARHKRIVLLFEGMILMLAGIMAIGSGSAKWIVMTTVFGMGLQNAFGKLFAKDVFAPTTMMTGNVTQAALALGSLFRQWRRSDDGLWSASKGIRIAIGGFFTGCVVGGALATRLGLGCILIPGLAITMCYLQERYPRV